LKGPKSALAKEFANFTLGAEQNAAYAATIAGGPTNVNAQPAPEIARFFYRPEEVDQFAYIADFAVITAELDKWSQRFEAEILPLIRRG